MIDAEDRYSILIAALHTYYIEVHLYHHISFDKVIKLILDKTCCAVYLKQMKDMFCVVACEFDYV